MPTLTAANCQIYLRDIITNPSSILTYWNNICDNSTAGVITYIDGNNFFNGNVFGALTGDHATGSLVTTAIGSTDTMPTANHTYAAGDTTFSNTWFLNHTSGATSDAVYANTACTTTADNSFWGPSYHTQLTAQIDAAATANSVSFETICSTLDAIFREPGDATAGYCLALVRQNDDGVGTYSCSPSGAHLIAPYTTARVYLSAPVDPPTGTFSASPTTINNGDSSTLTWTSSGADTASIDHSIGTVTPTAGGTHSVSPSVTTTYTLTLTNSGGSTTYTATVTVNHPSPSGSMSASPNPITVGDSTTLTWTSTDADSASLDHGIGSVAVNGTHSVSPTVTTTYTLTLTNPDGSTNVTATVTVYPVATGTFVASPNTIFDGQTTSLVWTSSNAVSASIDNGIGSVSPVAGGSVDVTVFTGTTYTLTLTNAAGHTTTLTANVDVNVRPDYRPFFAEINDPDFKDWVRATTDLSGTAFDSYFSTCQSRDDPDVKGNIPYVYTFMKEDQGAPQGAFLHIEWDWADPTDTLRVAPYTQVYNEVNGRAVSVKKTRVRGKGRQLHLRYKNDGNKDFNIRGWVIFHEVNAGQ